MSWLKFEYNYSINKFKYKFEKWISQKSSPSNRWEPKVRIKLDSITSKCKRLVLPTMLIELSGMAHSALFSRQPWMRMANRLRSRKYTRTRDTKIGNYKLWKNYFIQMWSHLNMRSTHKATNQMRFIWTLWWTTCQKRCLEFWSTIIRTNKPCQWSWLSCMLTRPSKPSLTFMLLVSAIEISSLRIC